ncbi:MAG: hypothetical protein AAGB51_09840 [Planctomycetota bacterium]
MTRRFTPFLAPLLALLFVGCGGLPSLAQPVDADPIPGRVPAGGLAAKAGLPPPIFADWNFRSAGPFGPWSTSCDEVGSLRFMGPSDYVPVAHPGGTSGMDAGHRYTRCHLERVIEAGAPVGVTLGPCTVPFPEPWCGRTSPKTLETYLDAVADLGGEMDYVFMTLEGEVPQIRDPDHGLMVNMRRVVEAVRTHPSDRVRGAWIGNYAWSATRYDRAMSYPQGAEKGWAADAYLQSGLNISMPSCYAYSYFRLHAEPRSRRTIEGWMGGWEPRYATFTETCPSVRAALFWAPLERLSASARELPDGHLLIPFVSRLIAWSGYPVVEDDLPTRLDCEALIVHMRLRGAHSYYLFPASYEAAGEKGFRVDDGGLNAALHRRALLDAWSALDGDLVGAQAPEVLNLETEKSSGINVSGVRIGQRVVIAVSNLSDKETEVDVDSMLGIRQSWGSVTQVPAGGHVLLRREIDAGIRDFDRDGVITLADHREGLAMVRRMMQGFEAPARIADIDGDGDVDALDERAVLSAAGRYE